MAAKSIKSVIYLLLSPLQWATSCSSHQYASQSFQVCRSLQLPLTSLIFRDILTRLAESVSEDKEDMQVQFRTSTLMTTVCARGGGASSLSLSLCLSLMLDSCT